MKLDVVIAGVGGQGTVLASRAIAQAAMDQGFFVRTAENIGMAQREGSVQSLIRIGMAEFGPLIPDGQADLLLGLELAEAARSLPRMRPGAAALINRTVMVPVAVTLGQAVYDREAIELRLREALPAARFVPATELAAAAGNHKAANVALLGAAAGLALLPFAPEDLLGVPAAPGPTPGARLK